MDKHVFVKDALNLFYDVQKPTKNDFIFFKKELQHWIDQLERN